MTERVSVDWYIAAGRQILSCGCIVVRGERFVDVTFTSSEPVEHVRAAVALCVSCWDSLGRKLSKIDQ
jgi:hypothetical protein